MVASNAGEVSGDAKPVVDLRLFVVGEPSGNPDEWEDNDRTLVLARDEREATLLSIVPGKAFEVVSKVPIQLEWAEHASIRRAELSSY